MTGRRDAMALEAGVDGESEHERESRGETATHLTDVLRHTPIQHGRMFARVLVRRVARLLAELRDHVRPQRFVRRALLGNDLDAVANARAGGFLDALFGHALAV